MELMRKSDIGDKLPLTSEQRQVFQPRDGTAEDTALATHSSCRTKFRIIDWAASAAPELFRGQPRAFGHRRQFGPHNVGIDGSLADPGAKAAIAAGDDVVPADEVGVAGDALRDQLRMLDEVRFRLDDPGNDDLALRQLDPLEQGPFMRVARSRPRTRSPPAEP